jgi:hypothetical protein
MNNQFDLNKFNSFLDMAAETIACGPECQNNKTADDLKNKYLTAQSNLTLAEPQYQVAKQNYYTYVSGESGYNEMMESEYKQKSQLISQKFKNTYNEEINNIQTQIDTFNASLINFSNVEDLYNQYVKENEKLTKQLKNDSNDVLTNERKTYYEDQEIGSLNAYHYYLLIIYVIVVICFAVFSFIYPSQFSFISRVLLLILFIALPFISTWILGKIVFLIYWLFGFLPKNVYK